MIQISRKEQQMLRKTKTVMTAEKADLATEEMLQNIDPSLETVNSLLNKKVLVPVVIDEDIVGYEPAKEQLQVIDDDPEVEQAWEDFRAVQGEGHMSKLYERNKAAEEASKRLEEVLFKKGRLTHMFDGDSHIWVTEDKVQFWQNRGWKVASPGAVPVGLQS